MGRVKIYVPGIYPIEFKNKYKLLPWAEPAMTIFGGNWKNEISEDVDKTESISKETYEKTKKQEDDEGTDSESEDEEEEEEDEEESEEENKKCANGTKNSVERGGPKQLNAETGWCCVPEAGNEATDGSQVFLFFEAGDINKPIYFAAAQSKKGWFSEHHNQYTMHTNNIRIRIDEESLAQESTCKFKTYNPNCVNKISTEKGAFAYMSPADEKPEIHEQKEYRTKLDMELLAPEDDEIGVHIKETGRVNIQVVGDIHLEHIGNLYQTLSGNHYYHQIGDTYIQREGNVWYTQEGNTATFRQGNTEYTLKGEEIESHQGNKSYLHDGSKTLKHNGDYTEEHNGNKKITQNGNLDDTRTGNHNYTLNGPYNETINGAWQIMSKAVVWMLDSLNFL